MKDTKSYLVKWEIDIEASSPEEAARLALEIQRDIDSEALMFNVKEQATGEETDVDILATYEDFAQMTTKQSKIEYIKNTIAKYGIFTTAEVEADYSPAISCYGDMSILIEEFHISQCVAFTYVHSTCTNETNMFYEDLDEEVINDICTLVENWEAEQEQTLKRCED